MIDSFTLELTTRFDLHSGLARLLRGDLLRPLRGHGYLFCLHRGLVCGPVGGARAGCVTSGDSLPGTRLGARIYQDPTPGVGKSCTGNSPDLGRSGRESRGTGLGRNPRKRVRTGRKRVEGVGAPCYAPSPWEGLAPVVGSLRPFPRTVTVSEGRIRLRRARRSSW